MKMHRPFKGVIKTCTIIRSATGKWYGSFSCDEVEAEPVPESEEEVGIDVGLNTFAYLSTGEQIDNPRFFREEEQALARAQRRLSKAEKGTHKRKNRRKVVVRINERIKNRRQNFLKAEEAARCVVKVPPAYTSQTCAACGHRQEMPLSVRVYECPNCGLVIDRDHNSSVNILVEAVGRHGCVIPEASAL
jgi:putative transposase